MRINATWDRLLEKEFEKDYFLELEKYLYQEYQNYIIFPAKENIFQAFQLTDYQDVKVVILGQDPYYKKNQSHGLAFSVPSTTIIPPSLKNIFKELQSDLGITYPKSGNLTKWAKQGVLLINTTLTVREEMPNSHKDCGWKNFTCKIIDLLNEKKTPIVFILWGNDAKRYKSQITNPSHFIIEGVHPSPLSAYQGFFGGKYFSRCNEFLKSHKIEEIDWDLNK